MWAASSVLLSCSFWLLTCHAHRGCRPACCDGSVTVFNNGCVAVLACAGLLDNSLLLPMLTAMQHSTAPATVDNNKNAFWQSQCHSACQDIAITILGAARPPQRLCLCPAGKVNIATMAADTLFASTLWCNAFFADMARVETGVECAFQFMAAFAVPADTSDTCTLMAWLTRWAALPMGLIVHCPPDMTARLLKHITHNVEKMVKASHP